MASRRERQAADYTPGTKAYAATGVATSTRYQLPAEMPDNFCVFTNETTATMYLRFGDDTVTVDPAATAAPPAEATNAPHATIPDGQSLRIGVPTGATHVAMIGGTGGPWRFGLATGAAGDAL